MRALVAALVLTLTIAVTASVFAIWSGVADAPWEGSVAESRPTAVAVASFDATQAARIVQSQIVTRPFPPGANVVLCNSLRTNYQAGNRTWVVTCEFYEHFQSEIEFTRTYVLDDETGKLVE